jgi:DNA-binding NtrC family response regulator
VIYFRVMKSLSILVVDDDQPTQRVLQLWLELHGHKVICASGGKAALAILAASTVDLVITDVLMPDGNGLDLISKIRQRDDALPVLAISGGGLHVTSATCLQQAHTAGAQALLLKPFKQDQLLNAMRYVLGVDAIDADEKAPRGQKRARTPIRLFTGMAGETVGATPTLRSREIP